MIYRQIGLKTNIVTEIESNKSSFEMLAITPLDDLGDNDIKDFKQNRATYFISGVILPNDKGEFIRNDSNLISRDLIIIDIEDTGLTSKEAVNILESKLKEYKYIIYSTISHAENNPRLRLILEPNTDIQKEQYKPTVQHVMEYVGLNYDKASYTWSQCQGIGVKKKDSFIFKKLEGKQYPVITASIDNNSGSKLIVDNHPQLVEITGYMPHDKAINIMKRYIENEKDNLLTRDNNYISCLTVIAKSVVTSEIEYHTALECVELLALDNAEWKENNIKELNGELKRANNNPAHFKTKYSFLSKFRDTQNIKKVIMKGTDKILTIKLDENGKVFQTLQNLENIILSLIPIAYNEITESIETKDKQGNIKPLDNRDRELLRMEIERQYNFKAKKVDIDTAIVGASEKVKYHPIKNIITTDKWDGTPRAESFFIDVLGVEDNIYNRECSRKWLLGAMYRLFEKGTKFDEMIILQGGQGIGKSTTLQRLSLGYYTSITERLSEEVIYKVIRSWLVELAELSTLKKTDDNSFKDWVSSIKDTIRKKYASDPIDVLRGFVLLGTTNNREILKDRTGNRRYWVMYCNKDNIKKSIFSIDEEYIVQMWREVYTWYLAKESLLISDEAREYMEQIANEELEYDPLEERLDKLLNFAMPYNWVERLGDSKKRFNFYNYINEMMTYGYSNIVLSTTRTEKIEKITTNELNYLLGDGENFYSDLRGDKTAKRINELMQNKREWKKTVIKRNNARFNGFRRK